MIPELSKHNVHGNVHAEPPWHFSKMEAKKPEVYRSNVHGHDHGGVLWHLSKTGSKDAGGI